MDLAAAFDWYSALARKPGWADYVWDRVRELAADHPIIFEKLPAMLAKAHPRLTQATRLGRSIETRATTYRLEPSRFQLPQPAAKTKGRR